MDENNKNELREAHDKIARYIEDLDAIRERAGILNDELNTRLTDQMNKNMYLLSIVAGLFLPLGFFTGLLGINAGGIPGGENPWAFEPVCFVLVMLLVVEVVLLKRLKWL